MLALEPVLVLVQVLVLAPVQVLALVLLPERRRRARSQQGLRVRLALKRSSRLGQSTFLPQWKQPSPCC